MPGSTLKRSRRLTLTTLMATASVNLVACDEQASRPAAVTWDDSFQTPASASSVVDPGEPVEALAYSDVASCKSADQVPDADCDTNWQAAQADHAANAPRYGDKAACEAEYGEGHCETRSSGGGSFFTPFLAGMVMGQILNPGGGYGYRGTSLYRDRYGRFGTPYSGYGAAGGLSRNYATGRMQIGRNAVDPPAAVRQAPPRVNQPTRTVSRGGFRSSGRSYGGRGFGG